MINQLKSCCTFNYASLSESKLREEELDVRSWFFFRVDGSVFVLELLLEGISNLSLGVVLDFIFLHELLEIAEFLNCISIKSNQPLLVHNIKSDFDCIWLIHFFLIANLVGMMWLRLMYLTKGLIEVLFSIFFEPILLVTFLGDLSTPATKAWPNFLSLFPSSEVLMRTAFLPANLP